MKIKKRTSLIHINNDDLRVDEELSFAIYHLNSNGVKTLGCCSGHEKYRTTIIIEEENGKIRELLSGVLIPRKRRFYVKDKKGFFYIPEIEEEIE